MDTLPQPSPTLQPYFGDQREHYGEVGPPYTTSVYGMDTSGAKVYAFNSLGFRGEEFRPEAKKKIFACGCSYSFGVGLDLEETALYRFKELYAAKHACDLGQVNLMNFSQGGGSNDYITRTLITQLTAVKADLVLAFFTFKNRSELLLGKPGDRVRVWGIGPWLADHTFPEGSEGKQGQYYYLYYSEELGLMNAVKNILLLQEFCRCNGIEYLVSMTRRQELEDPRFAAHPAFSALIDSIDRSRFFPAAFPDPDLVVDLAADGVHPGSRSNENLARKLFAFYEQMA